MGGTETLPFEQHRENALPPEVGLLHSPLNIRAVHLQHMLSILPTLWVHSLQTTQCLQCILYPWNQYIFASTFLYIFLCLAFSLLFSFPSFHLHFLLQAQIFLVLSFFYSIFSPIAFVFLFFSIISASLSWACKDFFFAVVCPYISLVLPLFFSCFFPILCLCLTSFCPSFTNFFFFNIFFSNFDTVFLVQHPIFSLVLPLFFSCFFPSFFALLLSLNQMSTLATCAFEAILTTIAFSLNHVLTFSCMVSLVNLWICCVVLEKNKQ